MLILANNLGLLGRLTVLLLACIEWVVILSYVYCLKRFRQKYLVRLSALILTLLCMIGVRIAQRVLYNPVRSGRLSVNEFDVVVIAESAVSLFILFYGLRKLWRTRTAGPGGE